MRDLFSSEVHAVAGGVSEFIIYGDNYDDYFGDPSFGGAPVPGSDLAFAARGVGKVGSNTGATGSGIGSSLGALGAAIALMASTTPAGALAAALAAAGAAISAATNPSNGGSGGSGTSGSGNPAGDVSGAGNGW